MLELKMKEQEKEMKERMIERDIVEILYIYRYQKNKSRVQYITEEGRIFLTA